MHPHQPAPHGNFPPWASWQEAEHLPIMEAKPGVVSQQPLQQKHWHTWVWPARDTTWAWYPKKLKCGEPRPAGGAATPATKGCSDSDALQPRTSLITSNQVHPHWWGSSVSSGLIPAAKVCLCSSCLPGLLNISVMH